MAKTYAPQFVRILRKLAVYATKHGSQMNAVMTPAQQAAVQQVVTAAAAFSGVVVNETP
jgi:hypothetical protein